MSRRAWAGLALGEYLVLLVTVALLVAFTTPIRLRAADQNSLRDCKNNLKQLGIYLTLYVSRYGSDRYYPTTAAPGGSGAAVPAGPNGAFWSHLYRLPQAKNAVSLRPGDDGLYFCPCGAAKKSETALEYTAPKFDAKWSRTQADVFPNRQLSEAVRADAMISGDLIGPPDVPNHGREAGKYGEKPGVPEVEWNALFFDGHAETIVPGSEKHTLYAEQTTGVRST